MTRQPLAASALAFASAAAMLLAGCASASHAGYRSGTTSPTSTEPYLEMTGPTTGLLVWPSGSAWLVLSTDDSFRHLTNRTPQGVETSGGLSVAATSGHAVVAVGAHDRLVRSPVLTATRTWRWDAGELPGAVAGSRSAVSVTPLSAIIDWHNGTLERAGGRGWSPVVSATSLASGLTLDAVTWASGRVGWLTGSAGADTASGYGTRDGGTTWTPIPDTAGGANESASALPPCGTATSWLMPILRGNGSLVLLRTTDAGASWRVGQPLQVPTENPVVGCAGATVWAAARRGGQDRVFASSDRGASWNERGYAPANLTDLSPTGGGQGFAATGGAEPQLWKVTRDGAHFARVALPGWLSSIGEGPTGGS